MERVLVDMRIEDCDEALALLQSLTDEPGLREVARLSMDDVLDRRNELVNQQLDATTLRHNAIATLRDSA